ncbi:unnamed protein product, partial [Staurois parvus]
TITYSCNKGFRLEGQHVLTCLETGEWDADTPSCKEISCDPPEAIDNGFVEGADYRYGAVIIYSCMPGFQLTGPAIQTCEDLGWSSSAPMCVHTDCGLPPHIDFGQYTKVQEFMLNEDLKNEMFDGAVTTWTPNSNHSLTSEVSDFLYGTYILYTCYHGYEILGIPLLACQEDGTWNGSAPVCAPLECSIPVAPENGMVQYTETTLDSTAQYKCNSGYELIGSDKSSCLSSKKWSNEVPQCAMILCKVPNVILNGYTEALNNSFTSEVHYKCDLGYKLHGPSKRTCQENKQWDGEEPICIPVSCGQPPAVINSQVLGKDYSYGKDVEYKCHEGYLLKGDKKRTCLENGHWSGIMPSCSEIVCEKPNALDNGEVTGMEYGVGKQIHVKCNQGFDLKGAALLTCQENGTWDAQEPLCEPIDCGPPEDISHGFLNSSGFSYNEHVYYVCFPGYEIHGTATRQCLANGLWSGIPPTCLPCECPKPSIQNAVVIGEDFSCGQSIRIKCQDGFKLLGLSELSCHSAGKWSSGFPLCGKVSCGTPPTLSHAFVNGSSLITENAISYNCETGYVMKGLSDLICTEEGQWRGPYPNCLLLSCGPPPEIPNTLTTGDSYTYESIIEYRCQDGYIMDSDKSTKTCLEDGSWSTEEIVCVPRKCTLQANTVKLKADYDINKTITVDCKPGYTLSGPSTSTCMTDGNWLPPLTDDICSPISCEKPAAPNHGSVLGTRFLYQDTILYQCDSGYEIEGATERVCEANKLWSGVEPECKRISCNPPEPLENGIIQGINYFYEDELHYSCNQGFELLGPTRRICHVDKQWRPSTPPTCVSVTCEPYPVIENAISVSRGNTYSSNVTYICNPGYHLVGPENITCLADGTWGQPLPSCKETRCETPSQLDNGYTEYDNVTVGSSVKYYCQNGYSLDGEHIAVCTGNGTWSYPTPVCKHPCPVPFVIPENAVVTDTEFYVGQKLYIKCRKGYRLAGQDVMTCDADETWTEANAKCEKISCGPPIHVPNAMVRGLFHHYGDMVTYSCYSGFMMEGSIRSVCLENQTWTTPPFCKAVCRFPCQNGGVCERPNACSCPEGWMGRLCEEPICILPCSKWWSLYSSIQM